eukprot:GFYU01007294.1.p1 GENE.GFYU01007294.1~~GFYU01007294.1.p1  ORF type:complete len:709 (+),score=211.24 GFYU01007294.1:167-2293(+)
MEPNTSYVPINDLTGDELTVRSSGHPHAAVLSQKRKPVVLVIGSLALFALAALVSLTFMSHGGHSSNGGPAVIASTKSWEQEFLKIPAGDQARDHLAFYTANAHVAGTPGDRATAVWTLKFMQAAGLKAEIEEENVLLTKPIESSVEVLDPPEHRFKAKLSEDIVPLDPTSDTWYRNHTFNAYSPNMSAKGELVYVNYGRVEDLQKLADMGVDLKGKVAIARYGMIFRGLKARNTQKVGMAACLIYSDPADDGYVKGKVYPEGPWRPPSGVQRGSAQFNSMCAGSPHPDRVKNTCHLKQEDFVPTIPVQPISYEDAEKLLAGIEGTKAPKDWQGGLQMSYNIGPGPAVVNVATHSDWGMNPIWNVVGRIEGESDRQIIIGNHRDAWVYGAVDPNSGTAAMMEVVRGLGKLVSMGWKPKRTIVVCSWDGEEYGLLGSTAFGERHAAELKANAAVYINVDPGISGPNFYTKSTPSLINVIRDIAEDVTDPNTQMPLSKIWDGNVGRIGSGSDYTVFLDHLGIASIDMGFSGDYGVYHSTYDSFTWMERFGDPEWKYHQLMAQMWGLMVIRLADSDVLPYDYLEYAKHLETYHQEVLDMAQKWHPEANLDSLRAAIHRFKHVAIDIAKSTKKLSNDVLMTAERKLVADGLPERPWFKHIVQAPGINEGYNANVFPGLIQGIVSDDIDMFNAQAVVYTEAVDNAANHLSTAQ